MTHSNNNNLPAKLEQMLHPEDETSVLFLLRQIILEAVSDIFGSKVKVGLDDIELEHPKVENYGDYATNIAMKLSGKLRMKPQDSAKAIAEKINEYIKTDKTIILPAASKNSTGNKMTISEVLEEIDVKTIGVGFINFKLKQNFLINHVLRLLENENIVKLTYIGKGKKIAVEYTDPNPFKEFHLGHMYSNFIGESIARIFEACGVAVWRGDFYGDVGMHVAKSVWGMMEKMKVEGKSLEELERLSIKERQRFLGEGYALGVIKYEEDPKIQEEIKELNLLIYVAAQEILKKNKGWQPMINYRQYIVGKEERLFKAQKVYEAGLRWSLAYFEVIYKKLGTKFDGYYPESRVGEYGMELVKRGLEKGVLEKDDEAVIYRGEQDGLHARVFVNKLGLPTYEAKDLGLAGVKYQDFKYDLSINVFGREIDEYYQVVKAAMMKIEPELGKKAYYIAHGMVKLPQGKMSSRTGNIVTFEWLLSEAKKQTLKIMQKADLKVEDKETVAGIVGLGAVRYALLKNSPGNDVVFDFDKSISFEGDSGPYLQYTYARCKSVERKAGLLASSFKLPRETNKEEQIVLRALYRFPEAVTEAARTVSPNVICGFLFDLSQKYNLFYQKHPILKSETASFRLFLTKATAQVLKRGLYLLGIETVEKM
jgi:arginyl-tRNA synthetase